MSRRILSRQALAFLSVLALLGTLSPSAYGGKAYEELFGKRPTRTSPTVSTTTTTTSSSTASSTTSASVKPQGAVRPRAKKTPGFTSPKIATTVPQHTTSAPTGSTGLALPNTATTPGSATTAPSGATPPSSTVPSSGLPPTSAGGTLGARPVQSQRATPKRSTSLSPAAIVAAALAVLLILICGVWGFARWYAYEPHWTLSLRHALAEAGARMSATWDEFSDWARLGR